MGHSFHTVNPTNLINLENHFYFDTEQVEQILEKAHTNWASWKKSTISERNKFLLNLGHQLHLNSEKLAQMMSLEMGKPLAEGRAEVQKCVQTCEYYAKNLEDLLKSESLKAHYKHTWVQVESMGVVLGVMPWNYPIWQVIRFVVPALAIGNVVLLKPAEITAGTAKLLENIFSLSSSLAIYFNLMVDHDQVAKVISDPRVKGVSFTGSEGGGRQVAKRAAEFLKKSVLELGGSDAYLILNDAKMELAIPSCVQARLVNNGQSCVAGKRFFVPRPKLDLFLQGLKSEVANYLIGDPRDEKNKLGPLAHSKFKTSLQETVDQLSKKASQHYVLNSIPEGGAFFAPQVLVAKGETIEFHQVELFGPVFLVFPYDNVEQALTWINSSVYGLGAAIFSQNKTEAMRLASEFQTGMVAINSTLRSDPRMPFGGQKNSGYGRELGRWGFYEFANIKSVGLE